MVAHKWLNVTTEVVRDIKRDHIKQVKSSTHKSAVTSSQADSISSFLCQISNKNPLIRKKKLRSLEVVFDLCEKGSMRIMGDGNVFAEYISPCTSKTSCNFVLIIIFSGFSNFS